ncbi:hypothetical protein Q4E93_20560 [Flavitalea sp. BT771]|uniref:hypothetical protein n=1 Tax=Flavitalea sp. BT771 TaxID=3063329 RepID=UPI0026E1D5E8|nr:hypothetical protein [Flavitalea sp. BT771]MDO6433012.1 hypothetical protein [Flavitalea sp. BT771]MDV6221712.1 hypothetical protein [Flavitalea sp. BT771]
MSQLTNFLLKMATDETLRKDFKHNPDAVMEKAGLSDMDRKAILSKNNDAISKAVAKENQMTEDASAFNWVIGIFITIKF